jgi:signal transduction histidine kinase
MTHELITPLHVALGFAELIAADKQESIGPAQYRDYAGHIAVSARQLLSIVKDMLALVKHDIGKLTLNESELSLAETLGRAITESRPNHQEAGVAVEVACPPEIELLGDKFLVTRAFASVISNAVKFSGSGSRCVISAMEGDGGTVRVRISDNGSGFDVSELERLSSPFRQNSTGLTRSHQGLGIGIPLAKAVFDLHQASMKISSAAGTGTTVEVVFPAHRALTSSSHSVQRIAG